MGGDKKLENEVDVSKKLDQVKTAFSEFKENFSELIKDLHIDVNEWKFSVENHKDEMVVDLAVKLVIKHAEKGEKAESK